MKKIALPVANGLLSAHFGHPEYFYIYETDGKNITKEMMHQPPEHQPGVYPAWLAQMGVSDIISGGMGTQAINLFNQNGINVFLGAEIKNPKDLALELLNGTLKCQANLCDHKDGEHHHDHDHHGNFGVN